MRVSRQSDTTNPSGGLKVIEDAPKRDFKREDFFRDLKKASRKQDRPSQRGSEKR